MKIYAVNISPLYETKVFDKYLEYINTHRRNKVLANRFEKDRALSLGVDLLLSHALHIEGLSDYSIEYGKYGKPMLTDSRFHFNLSHSGEYATCVIDDCVVGIDIENVDEFNISVAKKAFSPRECSYMQTASSEHNAAMFFKHWTAKESYIKAIGTGLSLDPKEFEIFFDEYAYIKHDKNNTQFFCMSYNDIPKYSISACSPRKQFPKKVILLDDINSICDEEKLCLI